MAFFELQASLLYTKLQFPGKPELCNKTLYRKQEFNFHPHFGATDWTLDSVQLRLPSAPKLHSQGFFLSEVNHTTLQKSKTKE